MPSTATAPRAIRIIWSRAGDGGHRRGVVSERRGAVIRARIRTGRRRGPVLPWPVTVPVCPAAAAVAPGHPAGGTGGSPPWRSWWIRRVPDQAVGDRGAGGRSGSGGGRFDVWSLASPCSVRCVVAVACATPPDLVALADPKAGRSPWPLPDVIGPMRVRAGTSSTAPVAVLMQRVNSVASRGSPRRRPGRFRSDTLRPRRPGALDG